ncbi:MAG: SIS domain-containing protein, partial [Xanthobacteraceae bacterium]
TKTFVASLAALLRLAAAWTDDRAFDAALERLPERVSAASDLDWSAVLNVLASTKSLVAIGRGPTLAIAREASLKFKETCDLHAEAFSGAEFLHGPVALVSMRYPILMFTPTDAAAVGLRELAADLRRKGAAVFITEAGEGGEGRLPALAPDHPDADAVCLIQSFYGLIVRLAERRGTNVNRPRHLQKVTRTR